MTRAEMRRQKRETEKGQTVTYNLTKAQLDQMVNGLVENQISSGCIIPWAASLCFDGRILEEIICAKVAWIHR